MTIDIKTAPILFKRLVPAREEIVAELIRVARLDSWPIDILAHRIVGALFPERSAT